MKDTPHEPWAAWAEQMQKWMTNPAAVNPFAASPMSMFTNPFGAAGASSMDAESIMKSIDPQTLDRRITDMRAVESWLKLSLTTLDMSIKTMEMQRDAYASFAKMREAAGANVEAMSQSVKRSAKRASRATTKTRR